MSAAPENDLLFGATAVELGYLTREQLETAQSHPNGAPLSDLLVEQGVLSAEQSQTVALAVQQQISKHGNDLERAVASVPPEIQALFNKPALLAESTIHENNEASRPFVAEVTAAFSGSVETKRYVVLRKHQQGGLGLVSVARDLDFNREVAFKEILPKAAHDEQSRQRFVREAEITGALEHPGVVPVYSLGTHPDGRPYYAMRFIRGMDLRQAIADYWESPKKDRPLKFRQLMGRFVNVCQTIHYAHNRGVLHRDIKPSNIMLGDYGETLVVDWGLAKASGEGSSVDALSEAPISTSGSSGADMTVEGGVIGTPIYMSPEQAAGRTDLFGAATDVYGLGATLYHLITGRPPFDPNAANVLYAVRIGKFKPPEQQTPGVPRPLASICKRAMANKPAERYQSAGDMALDLERWLGDEPVSAHTESLGRRVARWVRKRQALALSVLTAAAVALVAMGVGLAMLSSANKQITEAKGRADASLREAILQRQRAEDNTEMAQQAVMDYLVRLSEDEQLAAPELATLRKDLLQQALAYYQEFIRASRRDPTLKGEVASAHYFVGKITELTEGAQAALPHYKQSVEMFDALLQKDDDSEDLAIDFGRSLNAMGGAYGSLKRLEEAIEYYEDAIDLRRRLAELVPDSPWRAKDLAQSHRELGQFLADASRWDEAEQHLQRSQDTIAEWANEYPEEKAIQDDLERSSQALDRLRRARNAASSED